MRPVFAALGVFVLAAPVAVVGTFALGPLWEYVETVHGIEAVGHAMYAGWCFAVTYTAAVALGLVALLTLRAGSRRERHSA